MRRCLNKYFFHKWGKWKRLEWKTIGKDGCVKYIEIRKERTCERCNDIQNEYVATV